MKANLLKMLVLLLLAFTFCGSKGLMAINTNYDEDWETKSFGIVEGWIIDPDTNKPVNNSFNIRFYLVDDSKEPENITQFDTESDGNGYFKRKLPPGNFHIQFWCFNCDKYISLYRHYKLIEKTHVIRIKNGQITRTYLKAKKGGNLKISIVDKNGVKFDLNELFKDCRFRVNAGNIEEGISYSRDSKYFSDGDKNTIVLSNCLPGEYKVELSSHCNVSINDENNIAVIVAGQESEFNLVLNLETGIEGVVTNINGLPLESVRLQFRGKDDRGYYNVLYTDENGYYSLIGISPGVYNIYYSIEDKNEDFYGGSLKGVMVVEGRLIIRDIVLRMNKLD